MNKQRHNLSITIKGELRDFSTPWVMGIINVTPDSFYASSRTPEREAICKRVQQMRGEGAAAIDVGGYSSRPGASDVAPDEEYRRVATALECIRKHWPDAVVSVDTFRACVARRCVSDWDVDIINDISGGDLDPDMFETVAESGAAYILMHTRGTPATMASLTDYDDVTACVMASLAEKAGRLWRMGVRDIILDPGFGFAKNLDQNFELMAHLPDIKTMGLPVLSGISRKSMIYRTLGTTPEQSLNGTTVLNTVSLMYGADILRVHDVAPAVEAVRLVQKLKHNS